MQIESLAGSKFSMQIEVIMLNFEKMLMLGVRDESVKTQKYDL